MNVKRSKAAPFNCYGTLIAWETGISVVVQPWLSEMKSPVPVDLVVTAFGLMQARYQQIRPTLLYPEVLRRSWRGIDGTFCLNQVRSHPEASAPSVIRLPPFNQTVD